MPSDKPKHRLLRFSVRTLLIVLTVFCVWLGLKVERARKQREAVAWVVRLGGTVQYDYERIDSSPFDLTATTREINRHLNLPVVAPPSPKWLGDLLGIDYAHVVVSVNLQDTRVSNLSQLSGLANLESLSLRNTQVSDLTALSELTSLRRLWLGGTQVRDLTPLAGLTNLEWLSLRDTQVNDVSSLSGLKSLISLTLDGTQVSDLSPLDRMTLGSLNIVGTPVSDLSLLARMKSLDWLFLSRTTIGKDEIEQFRRALPKCKIKLY